MERALLSGCARKGRPGKTHCGDLRHMFFTSLGNLSDLKQVCE